MTDDRWNDTLDRIAAKFAILARGEEPLADVPEGRVEFVEFAGPVGRVRLERVTKPRTLGERAITSRRIGADVTVAKEYDFGDRVSFLRASRWDDARGGWVAITADAFTA